MLVDLGLVDKEWTIRGRWDAHGLWGWWSLLVKPEDLSLIPKTHVVEGENWSTLWHTPWHMHLCISTINNYNKTINQYWERKKLQDRFSISMYYIEKQRYTKFSLLGTKPKASYMPFKFTIKQQPSFAVQLVIIPFRQIPALVSFQK